MEPRHPLRKWQFWKKALAATPGLSISILLLPVVRFTTCFNAQCDVVAARVVPEEGLEARWQYSSSP